MIKRHAIPLLEYDDTSAEVIPPNIERENIKLPERCLFAFIGSPVDEYAKAHNAIVADKFTTISSETLIYALPEENICLVSAPIGASAAVQLLDRLISCGCKKVIATGSCGVLKEMPENTFLIPTKALRAEGTSYHYLPPSRYITLDESMVTKIKDTFTKYEIPFATCTTWTTDGFFRETKDMVKYRKEEGCDVVEMECSALAACARKRGALFGQFLFTADSLSNIHEYDARGFGKSSHEKALKLGLEVVRRL